MPSASQGTTPALQRTTWGDRWEALLRPLLDQAAIAALVRELALQGELLDAQALPGGGQRFVLRVERESLRSNPALRDKLSAALVLAMAQPVELVLEAGVAGDSIARRDQAAREAAQRAAEEAIRGDPQVQALLRQFPTARIVPGSIKPLSNDPSARPTP